MKRKLNYISALVCSCLIISCQTSTETSSNSSGEFEAGKDYFEHKANIRYAKNFSVSYHGNYKVVRTNAVLSSWDGNGNETKEDVMVLVQKGTPAPKLEGEIAHATVIEIPAERVTLNVENGESFMSELGLFDKVVAVGGAISYDDEIRNRVLSKDLAQVGYSWHQPANLEIVLERKSDLFFMNLANLDFAEVLDKSRELKIPTASVFEWAENDYLARAEWIKFYSLFFNAERIANEKFEEVAGKVESIREVTKQIEEKPTMVWGYYAGKDRWIVHLNSVEAQYMRDAGVVNVLEDFSLPPRNGGHPMSSEEFLARAKEATHWMIGDVHSASLPSENYMNSFQAWQEERLYHNMKSSKPKFNAFDWYGKAIARPDKVLADLVKLVHPDLMKDHELQFMDHFKKTMEFPIEVNEALYN